jgi:hypothetical protein
MSFPDTHMNELDLSEVQVIVAELVTPFLKGEEILQDV